MIVCICQNVSDTDIKKLLDDGLTLDQIQEVLNIGNKCGQCQNYFLNNLLIQENGL